MIYATGFSKEDLLYWGIRQNKESQKTNCRLFEARKLNDPKVNEARPFYCETISFTQSDEQSTEPKEE